MLKLYICAMLKKLGFNSTWVHWKRMCMSFVKYSVLVNGNSVGSIISGRGLQHGDHISLYLFLICTEGLSLLFFEAERRGKIHGGKTGRSCPKISHFFFMNDLLFFFRAFIL